VKLLDVINELVEERGLDRSVLSAIVCEGILTAYQKRYPEAHFNVDYDKKSGEVEVKVQKEVVSAVENEDTQISLRKAKFVNPDAALGEQLWLPFEGGIGRIEILKAKQVIASKIRAIEASVVYEAFKDKQGSIVHGVIHKCEFAGAIVKLQDNLAFLPKSLSIPTDKCSVGYPIKALLKEVLLEPRNDNQLILDRASEEFLKGLFELEIPEIFEKLVEIKKIARIAGYKSKVAVVSNDTNIDPVGTCVGIGGARIKPILKELGGEKIDIVAWTELLEEFVKDALKPAEIQRVELIDNNKIARVWLAADQRSLAIGKGGQNINLASQLAGVKIELVESEDTMSSSDSILDDEIVG